MIERRKKRQRELYGWQTYIATLNPPGCYVHSLQKPNYFPYFFLFGAAGFSPHLRPMSKINDSLPTSPRSTHYLSVIYPGQIDPNINNPFRMGEMIQGLHQIVYIFTGIMNGNRLGPGECPINNICHGNNE